MLLDDPPELAGIHHVAMITGDLDRFIAFYTEVLGAHVWLDLTEEGMRHAMLDVGGASLHVFEQPDNPDAVGADRIFARGHLDHLAIEAADEKSFETLRARLVESGATDGEVVDFGVVREVTFRDPDGHAVEIALTVADGTPRSLTQVGREPFAPAVEG